MEWSRKQRYRRIEESKPSEMITLKEKIDSCPWRQHFHIQPETGLLNDPNGFSYFNGEYHLFYQWFPLGPVHGLKYWYHTKSKDLVHWENVGVGIEPDKYYESHGAFSGSAIEYEGKLYLMYTGNTRDEKWIRHPYQCLAVMDKEGNTEKLPHPVISHVPEGYTDHFRDPKVWKKGDFFYAIIGAQRDDETGCVVLYRSQNLKTWDFEGEMEVHKSLQEFGFMWECPDYFELDGKGVLIFSPQGIQSEEDRYQNIYQSGYVLGDPMKYEPPVFQDGNFIELDRGFDFYAPQSMLSPDGRRLLIGWMGLPEIEYPTDQNGWAHCLTLPRELTVNNNKLIQKPAKELQALRKAKSEIEDILENEVKTYSGFEGETYELICQFEKGSADEFGVFLRVGENEQTVVKYDAGGKKVIFDRSHSGEQVGESYGTVRKCLLHEEKITFQIFVDSSSVEIFVNDGEEVFTGRIFPKTESRGIAFFANDGSVKVNAAKWTYN
ncbi:glycoside hydrolase family 32 protein [Bacillus taeanensis]|uniref:Sucrose-6-phosphate hydrolase n=1 Tax=Bacillus taeanensis TaxID=273032 RepID=A0A366Y095_9BACI|nr:sucrose-6-phosphate hydrolase [Bacillus taeanensis]RBW70795.1 sucrose-6-phosphate hydrolase [Bacillus taeanensis]